jgi:hypothetical protein
MLAQVENWNLPPHVADNGAAHRQVLRFDAGVDTDVEQADYGESKLEDRRGDDSSGSFSFSAISSESDGDSDGEDDGIGATFSLRLARDRNAARGGAGFVVSPTKRL